MSRSDVEEQLKRYQIEGAEDLSASIWQELQRRFTAIGARYPFTISSSRIERGGPWGEHVVSTLLLLLGSAGHISPISQPQLAARLFEELAMIAISRYTGGRALRIGSPRTSPVPKSFSKLLEYLSRELGEDLRRPKPLNPHTKDCRADIIAWRPFADGRGGQMIVLAQCAIGAAWKKKLTECNVDVWRRYLEFVVDPLRAFAIPHVEPSEALWLEYGSMGGIAFDRLRLVEHLAETPLPVKLDRQIRSWVKAHMGKIPWDD